MLVAIADVLEKKEKEKMIHGHILAAAYRPPNILHKWLWPSMPMKIS